MKGENIVAKSNTEKAGDLKWWQLSLLGVGCIIGTGFFLGSSIAIQMTGPSVLIAYLLAGTGAYIVYDSLGRMSAQDPQKGSFRSYAKKAFGPWAGFSSGWVYWMAEMLIMGSQLTALSIFTKFWFPHIPLWVFSSIYAVLGIIVVLLGSSGFEKIENLLGVIKISAILMFIILALLAIFGVIGGDATINGYAHSMKEFIPAGFKGLWSSLIFGFYAFGGIEVMGIMATRLKNKEDAPKSGKIMLVVLTIIYLISLGLAVTLVPWTDFNDKESPFVTALHNYDSLKFVPHVFNAALIIAGFSTMSASLFAVTSMLVVMAEDRDAPAKLAQQGKLKVPTLALALVIAGLGTSIILALIMPDSIYKYITTAASLMLLYNWILMLFSAPRLIHITTFDQIKRYIGLAFILIAITGTLVDKSIRPGLFVSLGFLTIISIATVIVHFVRRKQRTKRLRNHRISRPRKKRK